MHLALSRNNAATCALLRSGWLPSTISILIRQPSAMAAPRSARSTLHEPSQGPRTFVHGRKFPRKGYITTSMYGYALALLSRVRNEYLPTWDKHLRPDRRNSFRKRFGFFEKLEFPFLRSIKETSARPTLNRPEASVGSAEYTPRKRGKNRRTVPLLAVSAEHQ